MILKYFFSGAHVIGVLGVLSIILTKRLDASNMTFRKLHVLPDILLKPHIKCCFYYYWSDSGLKMFQYTRTRF